MQPSTFRVLQFHAFVSYRSQDSQAAGDLTYRLQRSGLRAWWDRDPGDHDQAPRSSSDTRGRLISGNDSAIESALASAIRDSMLVTVITSPYTLGSVWVRKEIQIARALDIPLFFWHVVNPGQADEISVRRGGVSPSPGLIGDEFVEAVAPSYEREFLPTSASTQLMHELSTQDALNVLGHLTAPLSDCDSVFHEVECLIELGELVLHSGVALTAESLEHYWPKYQGLCKESEVLQNIIHDKFNRRINVGRVPVSEYFRLKRPFVLTRIRHLRRLLEDDSFRVSEFENSRNRHGQRT